MASVSEAFGSATTSTRIAARVRRRWIGRPGFRISWSPNVSTMGSAMAERREGYVSLSDLTKRRDRLAEQIEQLETRLEGGHAGAAQELRGELQQVEREMRLIAGSN